MRPTERASWVDVHIGHRVSQRRKAAGLTPEVIAAALNITRGLYSRLERGSAVWSFRNVVEFAKIADCTVGELLD